MGSHFKFLGAMIISFVVVAVGAVPAVTTAASPHSPSYSITCESVSISGTVWTLSGNWTANNYAGQPTDYDVSIQSPTSTTVDISSKDSPDSFVIQSNSGGDMYGTWSNQYDFGTTSPTSIGAKLYHAQVGGHESADSSCSFTVPTRLTLHKTVINDDFGTAHNTDWTLTATNGSTTISGVDGSTAVTSAIVSTGTWTLGETGGPSGYTNGTYSCSKNGGAAVVSNTITLAAGDNAICTVTNNDVPGATITFTKTALGGDGVFSFTGTGSISGFTITTIGGVGTKSFIVNPFTGPYTITETDPTPAWDKTADTCASIAVSSGATATCGITNTARGSIVVHENVVAPDGTTDVSDSHSFTVTLNGSDSQTVSESANHTYTYLTPGTYTIAQDPDSNYDLVGITSSGSITLGAGQTIDVTITNKQKQGKLTVVKHVSNHGIGSSSPGDFMLTVHDANGHTPSVAGSDTGNDVMIDPGNFSVTENGPSGYAMSQSNCSGPMASNGTMTCTVTNSDIPSGEGAITVIKNVIKDNGGSAVASFFNSYLKIFDGSSTTTVSSGTANFLSASTSAYTVSEDDTSLLNYTFKSISCTDGTDTNSTGIITLADQAAWVCTITNDDIAPALTLVNNVVTDDGGTAVATDWTLTATGPTTISGEGGATSGADFQAGTYTLSESIGPSGYAAGDWSCTNGITVGEGNTITLGIGATTTCSITNDDQPGTIHVIKHVINDNGGTKTAHDFSFTVDGAATTTFTQDGDNALLGTADVKVSAGTHTIVEVPVDGYGSTSDGCTNIEVSNGGEATCIITNDDGKATLTIKKVAIGSDGTFGFYIVGGSATTSQELTTVNGSSTADVALDAGSYDVTEAVPTGWTLQNVSCVYDNKSVGSAIIDGEHIVVDSGDHVTCTFTDIASGADLSLTKSIDDTTPDHGQNVTYTLTAHNAGPASIDSVFVTDILPSGLDFVSADGDYATSTGIWTIGTLENGSTTVLHIVATVSASQGTTITNVATIGSESESVSELDETNDTGTSSVTVNTPAPSGGGGGGGRGGGNGPIVGSLGGLGGGQVLGISTSTTETGSTEEACTAHIHDFMRKGITNDPEQVKRLQQVLTLDGEAVATTGIFDDATLAAVKAFQLKYAARILAPWGISKPTGYVYLTTRRVLNELYCHSWGIFPLTADEQRIIDTYHAGQDGHGTTSSSGTGTVDTGSGSDGSMTPASSTTDATGTESQVGAAGGFWSGVKTFFSNLFHH